MQLISKLILIIFLVLFTKIFSQNKNFEKQNEKTIKLCERFIKQNDIPGMSVSISYMGKMIFSKGFGYSDIKKGTKVDPSKTKFRIASITKTITSATLAKLAELDSIDLDKSVYYYLDSLHHKKYDFTIRQVGGHLSGMIRNPSEERIDSLNTYTRKDFYRVFEKDDLDFEPSTKFQYSNYGFKLLGLIIEKKCGMSLINCQKEMVIDKLNLTNTIPDIGVYDATITKFYTVRKDQILERPKANCKFRYAEGCYLSTTEDLLKLGNSFLYENKLIKKDIFLEFIKSQKTIDGYKTDYGIGFITSKDFYGNYYFGHNGRHFGGISLLHIYPKSNLIISIFVNTDILIKHANSLDKIAEEIIIIYLNSILY